MLSPSIQSSLRGWSQVSDFSWQGLQYRLTRYPSFIRVNPVRPQRFQQNRIRHLFLYVLRLLSERLAMSQIGQAVRHGWTLGGQQLKVKMQTQTVEQFWSSNGWIHMFTCTSVAVLTSDRQGGYIRRHSYRTCLSPSTREADLLFFFFFNR